MTRKKMSKLEKKSIQIHTPLVITTRRNKGRDGGYEHGVIPSYGGPSPDLALAAGRGYVESVKREHEFYLESHKEFNSVITIVEERREARRR